MHLLHGNFLQRFIIIDLYPGILKEPLHCTYLLPLKELRQFFFNLHFFLIEARVRIIAVPV
jgi:hypothetical protein